MSKLVGTYTLLTSANWNTRNLKGTKMTSVNSNARKFLSHRWISKYIKFLKSPLKVSWRKPDPGSSPCVKYYTSHLSSRIWIYQDSGVYGLLKVSSFHSDEILCLLSISVNNSYWFIFWCLSLLYSESHTGIWSSPQKDVWQAIPAISVDVDSNSRRIHSRKCIVSCWVCKTRSRGKCFL